MDIVQDPSQLSEGTIFQIHQITMKSCRIGSHFVCRSSASMNTNWIFLYRTARIQYSTWRILASTVIVSLLRAWSLRISCSIHTTQRSRVKWICLWACWRQVTSPSFYRLWVVFAELPWEGYTSICVGCLDSRYVCTYSSIYCEYSLAAFLKTHWKKDPRTGMAVLPACLHHCHSFTLASLSSISAKIGEMNTWRLYSR